MGDRTPPSVFISYAQDSPEHAEQVRKFATFLRTEIGLEVQLDAWNEDVRRDWSIWATKHLTTADYVIVIASPQYKRSAEGTSAPDVGRGSQFEAAIIADRLTKNRSLGVQRVLPVVLPGQSIEHIPAFLSPYSTTRFHIEEFTQGGTAELLAVITGRPKHPLPERGEWLGGAGSARQELRTRLLHGMSWVDCSTEIHTGIALIDGVQYANSLVLRPTVPTLDGTWFVEIELNGAYRRMRSIAGVLDDATELFQVGQFRISTDDRLRHECKAAHGKPALVDVDVTGASRLRLEMCRPSAGPFTSGGPRLPELAWGDPTLY